MPITKKLKVYLTDFIDHPYFASILGKVCVCDMQPSKDTSRFVCINRLIEQIKSAIKKGMETVVVPIYTEDIKTMIELIQRKLPVTEMMFGTICHEYDADMFKHEKVEDTYIKPDDTLQTDSSHLN